MKVLAGMGGMGRGLHVTEESPNMPVLFVVIIALYAAIILLGLAALLAKDTEDSGSARNGSHRTKRGYSFWHRHG
jgi:hypothetical protein